MKTPRYGRTITKIIHSTFPNPDVSCRRKMSLNTVIRIQNQITQGKKMSIVQTMSRNG